MLRVWLLPLPSSFLSLRNDANRHQLVSVDRDRFHHFNGNLRSQPGDLDGYKYNGYYGHDNGDRAWWFDRAVRGALPSSRDPAGGD